MLFTVLTFRSKFEMLSTLLTLKFRERCMDLVSFESPEEYRHFALMLHRGERFSLQYRWLSAFLWLHVQTTSAQSGRLGGNATSGTRAATLRNFSRSTSTDGSGLMETKESHRPTSQASSHFGAGPVWLVRDSLTTTKDWKLASFYNVNCIYCTFGF